MTYKDAKIKEPELWMFEEYIKHRGFDISPRIVYDCFKEKGWKRIKGKKSCKSIEEMVNTLYSIHAKAGFIPSVPKPVKYKKLKQSKTLKKLKKKPKEKWKPYDEQLQDPRWLEFREKVFATRGRKCEHCGSTDTLQVHHPEYKKNHLAWQYTTDEVRVLCKECHKKVHGIEE